MRALKPSAILAEQSHRPWPIPRHPWVMAQTWHNLLFAHWPLPPDALRRLIPPGLQLDTFDEEAWVGVIPFHMSDIRARALPPLPRLSAFAELNVRTYVVAEDKPGVWFFSLDAANRIAVEVARAFYQLPYFKADMHHKIDGSTVEYHCTRTDRRAAAGEFHATYQPVSPVYYSEQETLDRWLTERYCLYAQGRSGSLYRAEIHHLPWPLQRAEADIQVNTVAGAHGIQLPDTPPLLHYAERLDILAWYIERLILS